MTIRTIRRYTLTTLMLAMASTLSAQDLIARQAPIDVKLKAVDSITLNKIRKQELLINPSTDLYTSWNNKAVFCYSDDEVPETYKIDLRGFAMPTTSRKINSHVGYRPQFRRMHKGLDIKVYTGDTIYAAFSGKVRIRAFQPTGFGNVIVLRHGNGLETIYGHLSKHLVSEGETVRAGQPIGLGGNTGRSFGSHLHFETRLVGALIDPEELFDFPNQDIKCDYYIFRKHGKNTKGEKNLNTSSQALAVATASSQTEEDNKNQDDKLIGKFYKVNAGENVSSIARKLDISVERLCNANNISRSTKLRPSQILRY